MRCWNFIKNESEPENVELRIDGDIVDDDDSWLYEWMDMKGASPNEFRNQLSGFSGKNITVSINSYGGNVYAAAGMYNALMEHKKTGGKVTTKTDQKVMSAATIPFMAGDERLIGPVDTFMIHNPLTEAYGYASDLRKVADFLDTVKESIINAYQIGTGHSRSKISQMMDEETFMSAKEAVKEKFATGMIENSTANEPINIAFSRKNILNSTNDSIKKIAAIHKTQNDSKKKVDTARAKLALQLVL